MDAEKAVAPNGFTAGFFKSVGVSLKLIFSRCLMNSIGLERYVLIFNLLLHLWFQRKLGQLELKIIYHISLAISLYKIIGKALSFHPDELLGDYRRIIVLCRKANFRCCFGGQ